MERNVRYIVKPENKLVVCVIKEEFDLQFRGIAKCSPDDQFDEEKGKQIAYLRACEKRKRHYIKMAQFEMKMNSNELDYWNMLQNRCQRKIDSMHRSLAKYREDITALCE